MATYNLNPSPALPSYNFSPGPSSYSPVFGGVPGAVSPAPSIFQQVQGVAPGLPSLTSGASNFIGSEQAGQLSPQAIDAIKNQSASWGVSSGMPGSGLADNMGLRNIGLATEQVQEQGVNDYLKFLGGVGATQTNPAINQELAMWNATNKSAPVPAAADSFLLSLLQPKPPTTSPGLQNYFTPAGSDTKLPYSAAFS